MSHSLDDSEDLDLIYMELPELEELPHTPAPPAPALPRKAPAPPIPAPPRKRGKNRNRKKKPYANNKKKDSQAKTITE